MKPQISALRAPPPQRVFLAVIISLRKHFHTRIPSCVGDRFRSVVAMPPSLKRPAADTTGKAAGKAAAEPADTADGTSKPRLKIQKKTYRQSRPWEGPTISEALTVGDALSTAYPGMDSLRAATFATVSLSGFAPGPTLGKLLGTLAPTVTCTAEAARPDIFDSAMTQHGEHVVKWSGDNFKCITCRQHRRTCSLGNVDILLMDGMPAADEEARAVQSFVTAVNPRVQICCQPFSERKALKIDPTWRPRLLSAAPAATPGTDASCSAAEGAPRGKRDGGTPTTASKRPRTTTAEEVASGPLRAAQGGHILWTLDRYTFCSLCGAYTCGSGRGFLKGLKGECKGTPTPGSSRDRHRRLLAGKHPTQLYFLGTPVRRKPDES